MSRIAVVAITAVSSVALTTACLLSVFRLREVSDGYLLLTKAQAQVCDTGGGCMVFSGREFKTAVYTILQNMRSQGGPSI